MIHIAGLLGQHAQTLEVISRDFQRFSEIFRDFKRFQDKSTYTGTHSGGVLGERIERRLHDLIIPNVTIALTSEEENVSVHIVEGKEGATGLVQRILCQGTREVAKVPQLPFTLGSSVKAGGDDMRRLAQPSHLGAFRTIVGKVFRYHAVLAGIEDAMHFILGRYAE